MVILVAKPLELQGEELLSEMSAKWTSGRPIDAELAQLRTLNQQVKALRRARETQRHSDPFPELSGR